MTSNSAYGFQCQCGANHFCTQAKPVMRAVCHCHNCQEFNQGPYGDFLVFRESDVTAYEDQQSTYRAFSSPPMVKRATCNQCGKPFAEKVNIPMFPKMVFVPVFNQSAGSQPPEPVLQMFTHRKVKDVEGNFPSYSGYLGSEVPFVWKLMRSLQRKD